VLLLSLETTCDETAAAVLRDDLTVLGAVVASQDELHQRFAGVVPEIAARAHLDRIVPVIDEALRRAGVAAGDLDAIAVASTPGLAGSLLVGVVAAKSLAFALGRPLVAVNHLHGHIYACRMAAGKEVFPCVGMIVSGGHSNMYRCTSATNFEYLGGTIDDAAGEAFDKVSAMLGLGYPGGPAIAKAAERGNPEAFAFPRSFLHERDRLAFSFSGLKTAVRYAIAGPGKPRPDAAALEPQFVADLAASFQAAVVDSLVDKAFRALERSQLRTLCVGGGVAANRLLRERLAAGATERGIELHIAPPNLCTDNAVMGAVAFERLKAGLVEGLDLDAQPGLVRS
jgi:N6-L-threonylcarbamoyladenine synthase